MAAWIAYSVTAPLGPGYGVYGIGIAAVGMLSIAGIIVANDSFGPIGDNARGIAEMARPRDYCTSCDEIDAAGNTTKAITKGFAIGAAGLTAIAYWLSYQQMVGVYPQNPCIL